MIQNIPTVMHRSYEMAAVQRFFLISTYLLLFALAARVPMAAAAAPPKMASPPGGAAMEAEMDGGMDGMAPGGPVARDPKPGRITILDVFKVDQPITDQALAALTEKPAPTKRSVKGAPVKAQRPANQADAVGSEKRVRKPANAKK